MRFVLDQVLFVAGMLLATLTLGSFCVRRIKFESMIERTVIAIGAGFGIGALLCLALALSGMFFRASLMVGVLSALVVGGSSGIGWESREAGAKRNFGSFAIYGLAAVVLAAPVLILSCYPPVAWDGLMYHLPLAELYAQSHSLTYAPEIRFSQFPQGGELLLAAGLLFDGAVGAQLVVCALLILTAAVVAVTARRAFGRAAWPLASGLWLSSPLVVWAGTAAYVDVPLACSVALFVYALLRWIEGRELAWALLASLFVGTCAAIKINGVVFALLWAILLLAYRAPRRQVLAGLAVLIATSGVYYVRSWVVTGNPVYPFLSRFFGAGWGPWDLSEMQSIDLGGYQAGVPVTLRNALRLPWLATLESAAAFGSFVAISSWFLLLLPAALLAAWVDRTVRLLLAIVGVYVGLWFALFQEYRGLIAVLPLLSLALAGGVVRVVRVLGVPEWMGRSRQAAIVEIATVIALALPGLRYSLGEVRAGGFPPVDELRRRAFVEARLPTAEGVFFIRDRDHDDGDRIATLFGENLTYYGHGRLCGDWFGPCRFRDVLARFSSPDALWSLLHERGFTYLLIDKQRFVKVHPSGHFAPPPDFAEYFAERMNTEAVAVYELRADAPGLRHAAAVGAR